MKILVTGAKGFVGKNLIATLNNIRTGKDRTRGITDDLTIYEYDVDATPALLRFRLSSGRCQPPAESGRIYAGEFRVYVVAVECVEKISEYVSGYARFFDSGIAGGSLCGQ